MFTRFNRIYERDGRTPRDGIGIHGDRSPDNVKFSDTSLTVRGTPVYVKCYTYHACTSVTVSGRGSFFLSFFYEVARAPLPYQC